MELTVRCSVIRRPRRLPITSPSGRGTSSPPSWPIVASRPDSNPGTHTSAFSVDFTGRYVTWEVRGQAVTATTSARRAPCRLPRSRRCGVREVLSAVTSTGPCSATTTAPVGRCRYLSRRRTDAPQRVICFRPKSPLTTASRPRSRPADTDNVFSVELQRERLRWGGWRGRRCRPRRHRRPVRRPPAVNLSAGIQS